MDVHSEAGVVPLRRGSLEMDVERRSENASAKIGTDTLTILCILYPLRSGLVLTSDGKDQQQQQKRTVRHDQYCRNFRCIHIKEPFAAGN